jgi:four helix bundle protein
LQNFRNLKIWHKAHALTLDVYRLSKQFPRDELYGLTSQMRRASVSIGANVAEGCCRKGDAELGRFLQIAMGSASELEYEVLLAKDLELLSPPSFQ